MKVKNLIKILQKMNPEFEPIVIVDGNLADLKFVDDVSEIRGIASRDEDDKLGIRIDSENKNSVTWPTISVS